MIEEELIPELFQISSELRCYGQAVIDAFPDHLDHLVESRIAYLLKDGEIRIRGARKSAYALIPSARGEEGAINWWALTRTLGYTPDALIVVCKEDWDGLPPEGRVPLVFHETFHLMQKEMKNGLPCFSEETGRPTLDMRPHCMEEFDLVAELFGDWHYGLTRFVALIQAKDGKCPDVEKIAAEAQRLLLESEQSNSFAIAEQKEGK